jgi:hypothetical protein
LRLLNSAPFAILLMAMTGIYVAIGYARPWFLGVDWPGLGDWLDMSNPQFFNDWRLRSLMVLLVMNLAAVTWRIPLNPSRYGAWFISAGIIALVCGSGLYYSMKMNGRVRIYADPLLGPTTVDHFYDADQRSLYVRWRKAELPEVTRMIEIPLPTLPRFREYDQKHGNVDSLVSRGLTGIELRLDGTDPATGHNHDENLADTIGATGKKLSVDVNGFYPDAKGITDFSSGPTTAPAADNKSGSGAVGPMVKLKVSMGDWSSIIYVPFAESAADHLPQDTWHGGFIMPAGTGGELQFQLGDSTRPLPARLALDVPSTVVVTEAEDRVRYPDVQHLKHAIDFDGGKWMFSYIRTDPSPDHLWIELGIANRPAFLILMAGGLMICVGILYAIFAGPIIMRRGSIKSQLQPVQS